MTELKLEAHKWNAISEHAAKRRRYVRSVLKAYIGGDQSSGVALLVQSERV